MSHRLAVRLIVLPASVVAVIAIGSTPAMARSTSVSGRLTSTAVTGASCTSVIQMCTAGVLTGRLKGQFAFTATSLIPTIDTPTTATVAYTGDAVIHTRNGRLFCKDTGALQTTGSGAFASLCVVTGGTGAFAGATGQLQLVGTFAGGTGTARYQGSLTTP
jgi:hypothetical protein